ncbi:MAG TPA: FHA domain-containing protein [Acidimicrobiales bacterium]|nr:FHA domain-containing protein [Acidimicrobiales bacterium]
MKVLATSLDNQNLLRMLEIFVVALIWLFFFRVIRAVWVEVRPPRARSGAAEVHMGGTGAPPTAPVRRDGRRDKTRDRGSKLRLKIVEPEAQRGQAFDLADELTVGRAAGCGVRVEDSYTSNIHARLFRRDGGLWVEDLGSTNGTWVNAEAVTEPVRLGRGDLLQVGGTVFEVTR